MWTRITCFKKSEQRKDQTTCSVLYEGLSFADTKALTFLNMLCTSQDLKKKKVSL